MRWASHSAAYADFESSLKKFMRDPLWVKYPAARFWRHRLHVAPPRCRRGMLEPEADILQRARIRHAPGVERAVSVLDVDGEADDMPAFLRGVFHRGVDRRRPPAGGHAAREARAREEEVRASNDVPGVDAQLLGELGRVLPVAAHEVVGERDHRLKRMDRINRINKIKTTSP